MMGILIRIGKPIYNDAGKTATAEGRSIPHQIEFWAKMGKCALDNPDLPAPFIKELLMAKHQEQFLASPSNLKVMMNHVIIRPIPAFKRAYKKFHHREKLNINEVIQAIILAPTIGQEKKDYLAGIFIYKFEIYLQEIVLAYGWKPKEILLVALGAHENFYTQKETKDVTKKDIETTLLTPDELKNLRQSHPLGIRIRTGPSPRKDKRQASFFQFQQLVHK